MTHPTRPFTWASLVLFVLLALAGCRPAPAPATVQPAPPTTAAEPVTAVPATPTRPATPAPVASGPGRGGSVSMDYVEEANSFDAILGYNVPAWQGLMNLYRGLMIYEGDRVMPEMADGMPEISPDGLVYTFRIRPGLKFSNGREVEAADFKYSLERVLDPDWASWATYYFLSIQGAQAVVDGKTREASGLKVINKYTLEITLTASDMTFLNVLALPPAWPVPREEVEKWGQEFEKHPVGTGPFMLKEWLPGEKAVFVPNPNFYRQGQPYIDEQVMYFGAEPATALLRLEKGERDVLFGDMIPEGDFARLMSDPRYEDRLYREPAMLTWWLGLNNKAETLSKKEVRQAINLAINRDKLALLLDGRGEPLYAIYPSSAPGFQAGYKPYPYNPAAARAKLAEAGFPDGLELELLIVDDPVHRVIARATEQDLAVVGIKVAIKQVDEAANMDLLAAGKTQMFINNWYMVQPDPADLINNLFMTGAGSNHNFYSNPKVDELAIQALTEQDRTRRLALYGQIEELLMDDAVQAPLLNGVSVYLHTPRIRDFVSRSEYGPYFERMWVREE